MMARGACTFRQRDVAAALKAARDAGADVQRIEIDKDGKIVVFMGKTNQTMPDKQEGAKEWDE